MTMGVMVYSLFWVLQDLYHQPYHEKPRPNGTGNFSGRALGRDGGGFLRPGGCGPHGLHELTSV